MWIRNPLNTGEPKVNTGEHLHMAGEHYKWQDLIGYRMYIKRKMIEIQYPRKYKHVGEYSESQTYLKSSYFNDGCCLRADLLLSYFTVGE